MAHTGKGQVRTEPSTWAVFWWSNKVTTAANPLLLFSRNSDAKAFYLFIYLSVKKVIFFGGLMLSPAILGSEGVILMPAKDLFLLGFPFTVQSIPTGEPTARFQLVPTPGASRFRNCTSGRATQTWGGWTASKLKGAIPDSFTLCKPANLYLAREQNLVCAFKATSFEGDKCVSQHPKTCC